MTNHQGEILNGLRLEVARLAVAVASQTENRQRLINDVAEIKDIIVGDGKNTGIAELVRNHTAQIKGLEARQEKSEAILEKGKELGLLAKGAILVGGVGGGAGFWHGITAWLQGGGHPK